MDSGRNRLVILVPTAQHKAYALNAFLEAAPAMTLPFEHIWLIDMNRATPAYAEDVRWRIYRTGIPFVMAYNDKDYSEAAQAIRVHHGQVLKDDAAVVALQAIIDARERLRRAALMLQPSHILWIDFDMVPPPDLFIRLLSHEVDVVSAKCYMRRADVPTVAAWRYDPTSALAQQGRQIVFGPEVLTEKPGVAWLRSGHHQLHSITRYLTGDEEGLVEVDGVGLAATLWTPKAAEAVEFSLRNFSADDMLASAQLQASGLPIYVDMSLRVPHLDSTGQAI